MAKLVNIPADTLWIQCSNEADFQDWLKSVREGTTAASLSNSDPGPLRLYLVQGRVIAVIVGAGHGGLNT